ncbi:MAG: acyl carrier protein [Ancylomarina sp.]|jgi:acyl carrier protein
MEKVMNTDREIREKLLQYIIEATFTDEINDETLLFEEGLFDSMGLLFLIDFIRDNFHIDIEDNELLVDNFESIKNIVVFINKKINPQPIKKLVTCYK